MELYEKEGSHSAAWVQTLNEAGEGIEKEFPDVLVGMHSYLFTIKPPKTIKPKDNVIIYMALLDRDHKTPVGQLPEISQYAKIWAKYSKHTWLWDYTANFRNFITPYPNHNAIGPTIKYCADIGFNGMRIQGAFGKLSEFVYMRNWMIAQLMWDPNQDPKGLIAEFLNGYYGTAGKYLLEYITLLDNIIHRNGGKFLSCYLTSTEGWLSLEDLNAATVIFNRAAEAVANDPVLSKRLRRTRYSIDIAWLERYQEFREKTEDENLSFLGPENPQLLLNELEALLKKEDLGQSQENRTFSGYLEKLKALFPEK